MKPTIVIVVEGGVIQEVATTEPKETWYRVIDLDTREHGDYMADSQGIDLKKFTKKQFAP